MRLILAQVCDQRAEFLGERSQCCECATIMLHACSSRYCNHTLLGVCHGVTECTDSAKNRIIGVRNSLYTHNSLAFNLLYMESQEEAYKNHVAKKYIHNYAESSCKNDSVPYSVFGFSVNKIYTFTQKCWRYRTEAKQSPAFVVRIKEMLFLNRPKCCAYLLIMHKIVFGKVGNDIGNDPQAVFEMPTGA